MAKRLLVSEELENVVSTATRSDARILRHLCTTVSYINSLADDINDLLVFIRCALQRFSSSENVVKEILNLTANR